MAGARKMLENLLTSSKGCSQEREARALLAEMQKQEVWRVVGSWAAGAMSSRGAGVLSILKAILRRGADGMIAARFSPCRENLHRATHCQPSYLCFLFFFFGLFLVFCFFWFVVVW